MKLATLTWYRGNNYGSVLQAYALPKVLESLGHECEILAYTPTKKESWKLKFKNHTIKVTIEYKINELFHKLSSKRSGCVNSLDLFDKFRADCMKKSKPCHTFLEMQKLNDVYDAFICGSDQIWNPFFFNPRYFLDFVNGINRKIAYAPSLGVSEIPKHNRKRMELALQDFEKISVRESKGAELLREFGKNAKVVADPTLLIDSAEWENLVATVDKAYEKPYILCYFLRGNEEFRTYAKKLADKYGYELKIIPMVKEDFHREKIITDAVGPKEWLHLIKNAKAVITDSFHCTVFSILFERDFMTFRAFKEGDIRNQNSRIDNFLEITELIDRVATDETDDIKPIDVERFALAKKKIATFREDSLEWLKSAIESVKQTRGK